MIDAGSAPPIYWVCDGRLAGMPLPSVGELRELKGQGVGVVITLTSEWYNPAVFRAVGLRSVHIPVDDMDAPSVEQIREFVAEVDTALARGEKVVAHCMGGLGRTGTMIACYLVAQGMLPESAVELVRSERRGSIQSQAQEHAIRQWWREIHER